MILFGEGIIISIQSLTAGRAHAAAVILISTNTSPPRTAPTVALEGPQPFGMYVRHTASNSSKSACHYYESSECAHVSINEAACYRTKRTLVGCADFPSTGVCARRQCSRGNKKISVGGALDRVVTGHIT